MTLWRWSAVAGIVSFLIMLSFAAVPGIAACGPGGPAGPWVDFQNVHSLADVEKLIRADCAATLQPALKMSMLLDAVGFIPAYLAFLMTAALAVMRDATPSKQRLLKAAIWIAIAGAFFDQIEGGVLLSILNQLPGTETKITILELANLGKSLALPAASAMIGAALVERPSWKMVAGAVIAISGIASFLFRLSSVTLASGPLAICWLVLLLVSLVLSFRKRAAT
jgi:hypothetical protein